MRSVSLVLPLLLLSACGSSQAPPPSVPPPPAAASAPVPAAPPVTVRYGLVVMGKRIGSQETTRAADGTYHSVLDVHDNGRGPVVESTFRLGPDGTVASYESKGHHTVGSPEEEHFALEGGVARWHGLEENGEKPVNAPTFFLPLSESTDTFPAFIAALRSHGGKLALAPAGEARIETSEDFTVTVAGKSRHLVSYRIFGVNFGPMRVWCDDDGSLFAAVESFGGFVRDGWDAAVDPLVARQKELDARVERDVVDRVGEKAPAAGLAFTHARVLDVESGQWKPDHTVLVVGDTIRAVGPTRTVKVPDGAKVVDVSGKAISLDSGTCTRTSARPMVCSTSPPA